MAEIPMTSYKIKQWYRDHLQSLSLPVDGMKIAVFKLHGKRLEIPIPDTLWQWLLRDNNRMNELRLHVMRRAIREVGR